jgi:flagellar FliL protein
MASNDNAQSDKNNSVKKPSLAEKLPKILLYGFLTLNFITMIGGLAIIYNVKIAYHRPAITEETESKSLSQDREIRADNPVLYSFDPFTVNLDGQPRKLVRTTIQLEMLSEEGYEEAVKLAPVERDQIVRILNSKKYEDIETIQGKLFLKDQIVTALNNILHTGSVKEVYFNDFVVQ